MLSNQFIRPNIRVSKVFDTPTFYELVVLFMSVVDAQGRKFPLRLSHHKGDLFKFLLHARASLIQLDHVM